MGTCNQLAVTVGILSSQVLGLNVVLGSDERWPWLLALGGVVPAALQLAMLPFVPESPRYDIINLSNDEKGLNSLVLLRTSRAVSYQKKGKKEWNVIPFCRKRKKNTRT